jgi:hypothetical protein
VKKTASPDCLCGISCWTRSNIYLIEELKEGLQTLGVLRCIQRYPDKFKDVFCESDMPVLDAQIIDLMFTPDFDEEGNNRRPLQEQAIVYWRDYLQDCESTYGIS